jgi:hypothetical protein
MSDLPVPTSLQPVPRTVPGSTILNGPNGNLVTEQKFGDIKLYLPFMIAKGPDEWRLMAFRCKITSQWTSPCVLYHRARRGA